MTHSALGKHMNGRHSQASTFMYKTGKFDFEQEQELLTLALTLWSALRPFFLLLESFEISAKNNMSTRRLYSLFSEATKLSANSQNTYMDDHRSISVERHS